MVLFLICVDDILLIAYKYRKNINFMKKRFLQDFIIEDLDEVFQFFISY